VKPASYQGASVEKWQKNTGNSSPTSRAIEENVELYLYASMEWCLGRRFMSCILEST
jgi:hypothetical protein